MWYKKILFFSVAILTTIAVSIFADAVNIVSSDKDFYTAFSGKIVFGLWVIMFTLFTVFAQIKIWQLLKSRKIIKIVILSLVLIIIGFLSFSFFKDMVSSVLR